MNEKIILHSDLNNFYASVERRLNPELAGVPLAVCGSKEERHGIVLAKSEEAKRAGVKTGDTIWRAKQKCPGLVTVPPHFDRYIDFSRRVKAIYARYTEYIESYGIDECWLDISNFLSVFPRFNGAARAEGVCTDEYLRFLGDTIRFAVRDELGLTVSVGVSFNKIFAKLGSDLKKPDGTSVISLSNFKNVIYPLPVEDLLMVGGATSKKLRAMGLTTIGSLAAADDDKIIKTFGKFGATLLTYARGRDTSPVAHVDDERQLKSIGNSQTYAYDLVYPEQIERNIYVLSESVAARLRESDRGKADTVHLWVRYDDLTSFQVQKKVRHTALCSEIAQTAFELFKANVRHPFAVRSLGVTVSGFDGQSSQITLDEACGSYSRREKVERAVDGIRKKHGYASIQRGILIDDPAGMHNDVKNSHLIKPARFEDRPEGRVNGDGAEDGGNPFEDDGDEPFGGGEF